MSELAPGAESIARHSAAAAAACGRLSESPTMAPADRAGLAEIAGLIIDMAAAFTALIIGADAFWTDPAMVETAIRDALTPAQVAELAARLA